MQTSALSVFLPVSVNTVPQIIPRIKKKGKTELDFIMILL